MIIHLDIDIEVVAAVSDIGIDLGDPLILVKMGEQTVNDERRYYYVAHPPLLLLLVMRGQPVETLSRGDVVSAFVGWDDGMSRFTWPTHFARQHTKLTIVEVPSEAPEGEVTPLSSVVARAPRFGQHGGPRPGSGRPAVPKSVTAPRPVGRPPIGAEPTARYTITITPSLADWLNELGGDNLSAGVRESARRAGYEEPS